MNNQPIDLKTCGAATWFAWALDQFNLFDGAPRPAQGDRDAVSAWIPDFVKWLASGAGNTRKRTVGQCLLRCYNDTAKVKGAGDLWFEYGGMDNTNRDGVRRVLEHVRYF